MRTYKRKKTECQLIEGVQDLCRLCLEKATSAVHIFTDDCENDVCGPLRLRIMICVGLEMTREDCLPNTICLECYKELEKCYTFRKKCEITYQKLKSHLLAVKDIERRKNLNTTQEIKTETDDKYVNKESIQHNMLSLNGEESPEQVNLFKNLQLTNLQEPNSCTNSSMKYDSLESQQNDVQMHNLSDTNPCTFGTDESQSPMPMILSSILLQLGLLQQHQDGTLLMVDPDLKFVELEGENNSKVTLELVEENTILDENESNDTKEQIATNLNEYSSQLKHVVEEHLNRSYSKTTKMNDKEKDDRWCSTCGKCFASRSVLARHQRVHSGERPYACRLCGRRFAQREVMKRHEFVHRAKRPFACSRCPKSFTQRGALDVHSRQHAPSHARALALHRCPYCHKVFLYASGLSRHMTVHSGKVFVCNACGRHFRDKSSLLRHLRKSHRDKETSPSALPVEQKPLTRS